MTSAKAASQFASAALSLLLGAMTLLPACGGSTPTRPESPVPYETQAPPAEDSKIEPYGPQPLRLYPIVLILGPGMAKTFAHAGVLEVLNREKIPVGAIISTEMGALIASTYATSKTVNEFDWRLMGLDEDDFFTRGFGISLNGITRLFGAKDDGSRMENRLKKLFGNSDLSRTQIPVRVGIMYQTSQDVWQYGLISSGRIAPLLRVAMTDPDRMTVERWSGFPAHSAAKEKPFPVEEARALKIGPIVSVNVLGKNPEYDEALQQSELVIEPDVAEIGEADFDQRSEAIYRGKQAMGEMIRQVRLLVGLPEHGSEQ